MYTTCPNCGYCPHCWRGPCGQPYPWYQSSYPYSSAANMTAEAEARTAEALRVWLSGIQKEAKHG